MSELKAFDIVVAEEGYCEGIVKYRRAVYDKSEADKVISDLEESHKMEVEQLLIEIVEMKKACKSKDEWCLHTLKRERHRKYKQCVAMAEWCNSEMGRETFACFRPRGTKELWREEHNYWAKWRKIWFELAQKFKESV